MSIVRLYLDNLYSVPKEKWSDLKDYFKDINIEGSEFQSIDEIYIELEDIPEWMFKINSIKIKPIKALKFVAKDYDIPNLNKVKDLSSNKEVIEFVKTVNQVVMPGYDLLEYKGILVLENSCTEDINEHLKSGWRIIAVLPQHNQRRPDYVLVHKEFYK